MLSVRGTKHEILVSFYLNLKSGKILVPTMAKTKAGFWLAIEPVEHAKIMQFSSIESILHVAISRAPIMVPTPSRGDYQKSVVVSHSGARSWKHFFSDHVLVRVSSTRAGTYEVVNYRKDFATTSFLDDLESSTAFSATDLDGIIHEVSRRLRRELSVQESIHTQP